MKKLTMLACALLPAISAFANGGHGHLCDVSGILVMAVLVAIAYIVFMIVIFVRWWNMTADVKMIRQHITHANPKLTYLIAVGEKEQAQKAALTKMVDLLFPIYLDREELNKAAVMNEGKAVAALRRRS